MLERYEARIADAIAALDFDAIAADFQAQDELVFIPRFLSDSLLADMVAEVARFSDDEIFRVRLPFMRKAGAVDQLRIARKAPLLHALHRSPSLLAFTTRLSKHALEFKHERDAHAAALYFYRRKGDHVGFHYDSCGCEAAASYTGNLGLIDRSTSKLHVQLFRDDPTRPTRDLYLSMTPGSLAFFCGTKAYHRVTPLGANEDRVVYSFAYVHSRNRSERGLKADRIEKRLYLLAGLADQPVWQLLH